MFFTQMTLFASLATFIVSIVFLWTNRLYVSGEEGYDFFESISYETNLNSIQKKYTFGKSFPLLYKHNISQVISTSNAFAIRIATSEKENFDYIKSLEKRKYSSDDDYFKVLDPHKKAAYYVVFGHEDSGGLLKNLTFSPKKPDYLLPLEDNELNKNHILIANDVCAQSNSFLALYENEFYCWGAETECQGWNQVKGKNMLNEILKVYCHRLSHAAFVLLRNPHEDYNGYLSPVGSILKNNKSLDLFKTVSEKITPEGILYASTLSESVFLLPGKRLLLMNSSSPLFNKEIYVENIYTFYNSTVITEKNGQVHWISNKSFSKSRRLNEKHYSYDDPVIDVAGGNSAFAVLYKKGGVYMIHANTDFNEERVSSPTFLGFADVKNKLQNNIVRIIANKQAFCAVTNTGYLTTWGSIQYGGNVSNFSVWPSGDTIEAYLPVEPFFGSATCCSFAFRTQMGKLLVWGNNLMGARFDELAQTLLVKDIQPLHNSFYVLTDLGSLISTGSTTVITSWEVSASSSNAFLPRPIQYLFHNDYSTLGLMGHLCKASDTRKWSECSTRCGKGLQEQHVVFQDYPINTLCQIESVSAIRSCLSKKCDDTNETSSSISFISSNKMLLIIIVIILCAAIIFLFIFCCLKRRYRRINIHF
ncbi:uncharacterized protein LOC128883499 isoform X2 [Hylaeus volcanicus]|uniref:uncharacterized protein LOC128883499 isoform X2 n=1 Tax=Hylaeus volcanicus TaxID=313075 RepID=UPI0023B81AAD|nr:uncharacterized protein LOC128883499 isoform X2 [Hylaeus volcanicus]